MRNGKIQSGVVPVVGVISDVHWRLKPPPAWAKAKDDWLNVQERRFENVLLYCEEAQVRRLLIAGDLFDRWDSPPELVNSALRMLEPFRYNDKTRVWAVPGQHDLPNHRYEDRHRSAYGTLVQAGDVKDLGRKTTWADAHPVRYRTGGGGRATLWVHPFPWGHPVTKFDRVNGSVSWGKDVHLALCHEYCWVSGANYPGAANAKHADVHLGKGYDVLVFGDNHRRFVVEKEGRLVNCGGLMPWKTDEKTRVPMFTIVWSDGSLTEHPYDHTDFHRYFDPDVNQSDDEADAVPAELDVSKLVDQLKAAPKDSLDFKELVTGLMSQRNASPLVREIVMLALKEVD